MAGGAATVLAPRPQWSGWALSATIGLTALLALVFGSPVLFILLLAGAGVAALLTLPLGRDDTREAILTDPSRLVIAAVGGLILLGLIAWAALATAWPPAAQTGSLGGALPDAALIALAVAAVLLLTALLGATLVRGRAAASVRRRPASPSTIDRPSPRRTSRGPATGRR